MSWRALAIAVSLFGAPPLAADARAQTASPAADPAVTAMERLSLSIQRVTLENGLRVVLNVDRSSPTVAVSVTYDVGSRNEGPGQSGFAHLFEHMMFQGSRNVKKGQHFSLISERGGTLNGTTSPDRTNYFEDLPSSELELALFLEADRMRWLDVSAENFENQRAVVKEEYRMRVENAPYARGRLRLAELVFADYPPYAHPTIGSMEDLDAAKLEWVQDFYHRHYAPNNAVLAISGDFDPDQALELVRKHFGGAQKRPLTPFDAPQTSGPTASQRDVVEDLNAKTPGIYYGYRIPPYRTPDHPALELVALLLTDGESSRLYQRLVRDRALLRQVAAWTDDRRGPDQLTIFAALTEKARLPEVERSLEAEIARLRTTPPSAAELNRVKSRIKHAFVFGLQANRQRALQLGQYELFYGDARLLTRELAAYLAVTPEDVQRVAAEYLVPERRAIVEVRPRSEPGAPQ
ncbi:MAG TPA: pitrilysin family protein [Polyangiaceae bacterium]|nr:pitrilysin family protein [Polyangiaceae bacterium]